MIISQRSQAGRRYPQAGYSRLLIYGISAASVGAITASGSTVQFFSGVSSAGGISSSQGISRPTVQLADAGGGTYTVTKTHALSGNLKPSTVAGETYLIDGALP